MTTCAAGAGPGDGVDAVTIGLAGFHLGKRGMFAAGLPRSRTGRVR